MRNLTILGSTGSVGVNTLEVVALHPDKFRVVALTARHQLDLLFAQCLIFKPLYAVVLEPQSADLLAKNIRKAGL
jgi:1-deoxy-D-xylulose-5-phosphate reductoisomerase